ncbi:MAG: DUF3530 family protein, partial [Pontibacterium sp.]
VMQTFPLTAKFLQKALYSALIMSTLGIPSIVQAEGDEETVNTQQPLQQGVRVQPNPEAGRVADLAKTIAPETEATWLSIEDGSQHLSLYHPASQAAPLGGVVLLPDRGMHADWPVDAHPLRLFLTDAGWQTLSVQLPPLQGRAIPERTLPSKTTLAANQSDEANEANNEASAEGESPTPAPNEAQDSNDTSSQASANENEPTETIKQYTPLSHQQIASAGRIHLASKGSRIVVYLGIGQSAITALEMAAQVSDEDVATGVLLFNAMQPLDRDAPNLLELLSKVQVPIIDVYTGPPRSLSEFEAPPKQRARVAKRNQLQYIQRRLSDAAPVGVHKQRWFSQQIAGLLLRHIHAPLEEKAQLIDNVQQDESKFEQPPGTPPPQPPDAI